MATGVPYINRVVRINLKTGEITKSVLDPETTRKFVGGYGIGMKFLYDEVPPETVKPFDPENKLIFQAAPLNGHQVSRKRYRPCLYLGAPSPI